MKKIYRIKILKIIQTLFFNLSVGFVSSFLILGNFLLLIPQIFPIVLLILILYTVISCYGNEIVLNGQEKEKSPPFLPQTYKILHR